jgi:alpha-L-fucosidase 2
MNHSTSFSDYERYLDFNESITGVYYVNSGIRYSREYIASNPEDILAIRIASNVTGSVSFHLHLRRSLGSFLNRYEDFSKKSNNDSIIMGGHSPSASGLGFAAGARVVARGGQIYTIGDTILCDNADEAWIYFTAHTTHRKSDPEAAVRSSLETIESYDKTRAAHITDYQKYANRVSLSLGRFTDSQRAMPTAQRIASLTNTFDPEIISQYFQFGRYLLISSSRENTLPANLQGIWSPDRDPSWGSKYTTNINIQMNYWPSLVTNLADLTPL